MRENRPSGSEGGVALIPPSLPLSCAAATLHGTFDFAKRMECASLLALSKSPTSPGDLAPRSCLPQATRWAAHPTPLPIRGPDSTRARGRGGTHPSMSAQRLRLREAFGVRQLAGAVEEPHFARRPTATLLPFTKDRMGCSPDDIAHSTHFLSYFSCKCLMSSDVAPFGVSFVAIQGALFLLILNT